MKKAKLLIGAILIAVTITSVSSAGNGNGANSGSGGNSNNNGGQGSAWILHNHGNGTYSMMHATPGSMAGHAAHGDLWYKTGCPLTGPESACLPN